jgi:DNA polymerase-1
VNDADLLPPISLDLETYALAPGSLTPPPVVGSMCFTEVGTERLLHPKTDLVEWAPKALRSRMLVGANTPFDLAVLVVYGYVTIEEVFAALREGRVWDVQIAQALDAIAGGHLFKDPRTMAPLRGKGGKPGRYSLDTCVQLALGRTDAKENDFWRMRYALLADIPLEKWPKDARQYPLDDVRNTMDVFLRQIGHGGTERYRNLHDMQRQVRAAFCLHLAAIWGLRTDPERVAEFEKEATARAKARLDRFTGVFLRSDGSKDSSLLKRAVASAYGASGTCTKCGGSGKVPSPKTSKPIACKEGCDGTGLDLSTAPGLPRTDTNGVATDRDTLMESGDEQLYEYGESGEKDYVDFLKGGLRWPINPRHNVLVETGRTSSDLQQLPKSGGVREAIVPYRGSVFNSVDYAAIELCTLAQTTYTLFGYSRMREVINEIGDPGALHTALGAKMLGISFEEMRKRVKDNDKRAKAFRQASKPMNFGAPAGMGEATIVLSNRKKIVGETKTPDGEVTYAGIRFCILIGGAERCGVVKVTEWKGKVIPPTCRKCIECAGDLRAQWYEQWPEMREYFGYVNAQVEGKGSVVQFYSDRERGDVTFTSAANGFFQAWAADGAKDAMFAVADEAHCDPDSPMYGLKIANFVHDELVTDLSLIPREKWHEAAYRQAEVMREVMQRAVPDVKVSCGPALSYRISKDAVEAKDRAGRLIPWEDACQKCVYPEKKIDHTFGGNCRAERIAA